MPSTYARSFVKGVMWESIAFLITAALVYLAYGGIVESLKFSFIITLIKMPLFFLHERIWKTIKWGKISRPPRESLMKWLPFHAHSHEY